MKRSIVLLVALLFVSVLSFGQQVICEGIAGPCYSGIPPITRDFLYDVTAPPGDPMTDFEVGTDRGNIARYINWVMPPGWSVNVVAGGPGHWSFTPKGSFSPGPVNNCPLVVSWNGPGVMAGLFGYDHLDKPPTHNVGWNMWTNMIPRPSPPIVENWGSPVGQGQGPVHGPKF